MDRAKNPYAPGAGSRPPALTGRDPEIQQFELMLERLEAGRHEKSLLVTGLRGVGKTVLLNSLAERAEKRKWAAYVSELQTTSVLAEVVARIVRRALMQMSTSARMKSRAMKALAVLKAFTLTVGDIPIKIEVQPVAGLADSGDLEEDLGDLLLEVGATAHAGKIGVVILLDEMQLLGRSELEALIAAFHKVAQKALPVALVGAGLPLLPKLAGEAKSYAERLFEFRKIGSLNEKAAQDALTKPAASEGVVYDMGAVRRILEYSESYPYFLQEYGKHVWNVATRSPISIGDVERAHPIVLGELDEGFYEVRLERTPASERKYMIAMAALGHGPARSGEVARVLGFSGPGRAAVAREGLLKKGLIYSPKYGEVSFTVPRFAEFLERTSPEEIADLQHTAKRQVREHRARATSRGRRRQN